MMSGVDGPNSWRQRYLASIAREQRVLDEHDPSIRARSMRADAYVTQAVLLVCFVVGGIVVISTGNPWGILVGVVLVAAVGLGIVGLALGRRR